MAVVALGMKTVWPDGPSAQHGFEVIQTHLREAGREFDRWQWLSKPAYTAYLERRKPAAPVVTTVEYRKDLLTAVRCCTAPNDWEWLWRF